MRNFNFAIAIAIIGVLFPITAQAQVTSHERLEQELERLTPPRPESSDDWKVKGYVHGGVTDSPQTFNHYRLFVENADLWNLYFETDWPSGFNGSWLKELHVDVPVAEGVKMQIGRIFEPGCSIYGPGPDGLRFVNYQHAPREMSFYGYGSKFMFDLGDRVDFQLAFTGRTDTAFDAPDQFSRLETSFRIRKSWDKATDITLAGQYSDVFSRTGIEFRQRSSEHFRYSAGVLSTDKKVKAQTAGFAQAEYQLGKSGIWPHVRFDLWPQTDEVVTTYGALAEIGAKKRLWLIGDWNEVEGWQARAQWRFGSW